jgi:hypothetical protein
MKEYKESGVIDENYENKLKNYYENNIKKLINHVKRYLSLEEKINEFSYGEKNIEIMELKKEIKKILDDMIKMSRKK